MAKRTSLAETRPRLSPWINALLAAATVLFLVGIFAPLVTFKKLVIFKNTVSMVSALQVLFEEGQIILFLLIFAFSICLPIGKLIMLFRVWHGRNADPHARKRHLLRMEAYGKWSMLDVFVVALLVVVAKLGFVGSIDVHWGIYAFGAAVVLMMAVTHLVVSVSRRLL